jgi:UDP-glucose:(heptosyl)LPS alpha-1,3-glucosyltransferase
MNRRQQCVLEVMGKRWLARLHLPPHIQVATAPPRCGVMVLGGGRPQVPQYSAQLHLVAHGAVSPRLEKFDREYYENFAVFCFATRACSGIFCRITKMAVVPFFCVSGKFSFAVNPMKILFALYKYFPWGGLQKDTLRFAMEAVRRGHQVTIFTTEWTGDRPDCSLHVEIVPIRAMTNHRAMDKFAKAFLEYRYQHSFDVTLAMNRIPGADFYFAADSCMASWMPTKHSAFFLKTIPRYRTYLRHEREIADPLANTRIMYIAPPQKQEFMQAYRLPEERFIYLPPGMDPRCRRPENADELRRNKRMEFGLADDDIMLIEVGTNLWRKGVDRVLHAVAELPESIRRRCRFFLAGNDSAEKLQKLALSCKAADRVTFLGPRDDVPELLLAADVMVHPAREEGTGTVLIEGLAAGLPVICSAACGFSSFVQEATQTAIPEPFAQEKLNKMLVEVIEKLPGLAARTITFAQNQDFCGRNQVAIDAMEAFAVQKQQLNLSAMYDFSANDKLMRSRDFYGTRHGFATVKTAEVKWTMLSSLPLELLQEILACHQKSCSDGSFLKSDAKRRITRVRCRNHSYIVKEFCKDFVWAGHRHGRSAWKNSQRLRGYTAPCLAWLRTKGQKSFLIFSDLGQLNLYKRDHHQREDLQDIYDGAGQLLAELHACGVYHADTKTANFVINDLCPWIDRQVLLVDCDQVRLYRNLPNSRRIKNLGQFLATTGHLPAEQKKTLIQTFLHAYGNHAGLSVDEINALLEQVNQQIHTGKISENNHREKVDFKIECEFLESA